MEIDELKDKIFSLCYIKGLNFSYCWESLSVDLPSMSVAVYLKRRGAKSGLQDLIEMIEEL